MHTPIAFNAKFEVWHSALLYTIQISTENKHLVAINEFAQLASIYIHLFYHTDAVYVCVCAAMIVWLHKKLTLIKSYNELLCWFINLGNHPKKPHSLFTSNKWFNLKSTNNVFLLVFFFFSFSHKYWRLEFNMNDFSSTKIPNMPWFKLHK